MTKLQSTLLFIVGVSLSVSAQTAYTGMRGITALEVTAEMAPGLNLFNTLDAVCWWCSECANGMESETVWGNPYTTPEMIQAIADRGFKSLRIPVTWFNHMGEYPNYSIDEEWMDRVEEVANYAFDANLYVILNIHHDDYNEDHEGSWICPTYEKQDTVTDQLVKVWTQIATRFKDYGDYLIFETMNEPREVGGPMEWSGGTAEHREVINAFNLAAVNAIRSTGGNNETRFIMLPQVGANVSSAIEDMIIPNNDTNTIVSVHSYSPWWYCGDDNGSDTWGTASEISALRNEIKSISDHFVANGQAVIIGEWGAKDKDNYANRVNYYDTYTQACKDNGITPICWMFSFNRKTLTWGSPMVEDAMLLPYDSTAVSVEEIILDAEADTLYAGETIQLNASIFPDSASLQYVVWESSNKGVATVDQDGLLTASARGRSTVTASSIGADAKFTLVVLDTLTQLQFFFEAEDYLDQSGIQTEGCSDVSAGQNIGYIQSGDWCSYFMVVDSAGVYSFAARAATETNGGRIELRANNIVLGEAIVEGSKSNGWQDWYTTESSEIVLNEGIYDLRLVFKGGGGYLYNLNWFTIDYIRPYDPTLAEKNIKNHFDFQVYPNPFSEVLYVSYRIDSPSDIDVKIFDARGRMVEAIVHEVNQLPGSYTHTWNEEGLPNGIYFMRLVMNDRTETIKLVLNK